MKPSTFHKLSIGLFIAAVLALVAVMVTLPAVIYLKESSQQCGGK